MYARLVLNTDGGTPPSYSVDMPNYSMITVDYVNSWAVVSIGFRDQPPTLPTLGTPLYPLEDDKYVLIGLTPEQLAAWYVRLDGRYPPPHTPFRPDFP